MYLPLDLIWCQYKLEGLTIRWFYAHFTSENAKIHRDKDVDYGPMIRSLGPIHRSYGPKFGTICLQCERPGFNPWVRKIPWRREWQPTPVFLPGESHGQRSLVGYSPWGRRVKSRLSSWHTTHKFGTNL